MRLLLALILRLIALIRLRTSRFIARLVHYAIFNAFLPKVPPPNWNKMGMSTARIDTETTRRRLDFHRPGRAEMRAHVQPDSLLDSSVTVERIVLVDVPAVLEIPLPPLDTVSVKVEEPDTEENGMAPVKLSPSTEIDFSIYADVSSPNLNKAMFITPSRSAVLAAQEFQFNLLKAASERVSEILRENRRRLDAGEDPNTTRREARRRRSQELSASRNSKSSGRHLATN